MIARRRSIWRSGSGQEIILDKHEFDIGTGNDLVTTTEERTPITDWKGIADDAPTFNFNLEIGNHDFRTAGEITRVLKIGASTAIGDETVGEQLADIAATILTGRLNLELEQDQELMGCLAGICRTKDGLDNDGKGAADDASELRVPGRININTAPQLVVESLPHVNSSLAQAIIAYRDQLNLSAAGGPDYTNRTATGIGTVRTDAGFARTAELMNVTWAAATTPEELAYDIRSYAKDNLNNEASSDPNVAPCFDVIPDTAVDDLEERDVLFARVSNLVTVRSDVFTAYILVRLGETGPQRRVIAIFDRSNVFSPADKPKLVALHPVPDPR